YHPRHPCPCHLPFSMIRQALSSPLFPYTTLFRSVVSSLLSAPWETSSTSENIKTISSVPVRVWMLARNSPVSCSSTSIFSSAISTSQSSVCEGSLFSIDPVIDEGAVMSVSESPKAASALLTAVNRSDTGARATGHLGAQGEDGMVTIRAANTSTGEDNDHATGRTTDRGGLPRRRTRR